MGGKGTRKTKSPSRRWGPTIVADARRALRRSLSIDVEELEGSIEHVEALRYQYGPNDSRYPDLTDFAQKLSTQQAGTARVRDGLADATLYWVTARMSRTAAAAAQSLPQWSPVEATPSNHGMALFEEPIGEATGTVNATGAQVNVPLDGVVWSFTDETIELAALSRLRRHTNVVPPHLPQAPVYAVQHFNRGRALGDDFQLTEWQRTAIVSVLGSLWLLMGQDNRMTTVTPTIGGKPTSANDGDSPATTDNTRARPRMVSVVDLHPDRGSPHDVSSDAHPETRVYHHRWWVDGHWRQQACGRDLKERRPTWIAPHVKGPADKPFITDRVYRVDATDQSQGRATGTGDVTSGR